MMKGSDPPHPHVRAFLQGLRAHGFIEGQNLFLERRSAEGSVAQAAEIMADLIGRNFDVIATAGNESAQAAKRATNLIPIVMATSASHVFRGRTTRSFALSTQVNPAAPRTPRALSSLRAWAEQMVTLPFASDVHWHMSMLALGTSREKRLVV
jgi:hypothetical protein